MADRWVQQNLSVEQQVTEIYVATFGRAPDAAGLAYWVNEVETGSLTIEQVAQSFFDQPETQARYPDGTTETSFVLAVYTNALQRSPDEAGFNYWVAELESGAISRELFIISILRGAYDDVSVSPPTLDNSLLTNLRIASEYYADSLAAQADQFVLGEAYAVLEPVTADASTIALSQALTREFSEGGGEQRVFTLTDGIDTLVGNDADNSFFAPVVQNDLGALSNTFETGDVLNGGDGRNVLRADLITSASTTIPIGPAISATTNDIEEVYLRAQNPSSDILVNWSTVDAERMFGVEQWWTDNSRSTIQIEDVRSLPEETTFGMRQTDPVPGGLGGIFDAGDGASLLVYFDPAQVSDDRIVATESDLTLVLVDSSPDANELENFPVDGVIFELNGERYTVEFDLGVGDERTYANLVTQLNAALDADPELSDLNAVLNPDNTVTISDPNGGTFEAVGYSWIDDVVPPSGTLNWDLIVGAPIEETAPVETNVVLDDVGRTSQGGELDIGSMGAGGVAVFNVTVDRSSWLTEMASNSNLGDGPGNLETVNLASTGANGNLTVGYSTNFLDGRVINGLTDVRTVDGSVFAGRLNLGINLNFASIGRYLAGATGEVEFNYTGSAQNDNFTIGVDASLAADPDFAMNVLMGAGDDRLNIDVPTARNVVVDGGAGDNTIAVSRSHGTTAANTFENFSNFQTYEVEGGNNTQHNFSTLPGVGDVVIATVGGVNTQLIRLEADTSVTISGKNQTLNNTTADQFFGRIQLTNALGAAKTIELDNTARLANTTNGVRQDGVLTVARLDVDSDATLSGTRSDIRDLTISSNGGRNTANAIADFRGRDVETLTLTGTQDLTVNVVQLANQNAAPGVTNSTAVNINASTLTGNLNLALLGSQLKNINDNTVTGVDTIVGTANPNDVFMVYGSLTGNNQATVSGFETIQLGSYSTDPAIVDTVFGDLAVGLSATGTLDATNIAASQFVVADVAGFLTLTHLGNDVTVALGDANRDQFGNRVIGQLLGEPVTLQSGANVGTPAASINVDLLDVLATGQVHNLTIGSTVDPVTATLVGGGYQTINLDVAKAANSIVGGVGFPDFRGITLNLDADARVLNVTGGDQAGVNAPLAYDGLFFFSELPNTLSKIDLSGYAGSVEQLVMQQGDLTAIPGFTQSDVEFVMSRYDASIVLNDGGSGGPLPTVANVQHNSIFLFTDERGATTTDGDLTVWAISDAIDGANGSIDNVTRFDLQDLGITRFDQVDVSFDAVSGDTLIRSEQQVNDTAISGVDQVTWEVRLVGVDYTGAQGLITADNFIFV